MQSDIGIELNQKRFIISARLKQKQILFFLYIWFNTCSHLLPRPRLSSEGWGQAGRIHTLHHRWSCSPWTWLSSLRRTQTTWKPEDVNFAIAMETECFCLRGAEMCNVDLLSSDNYEVLHTNSAQSSAVDTEESRHNQEESTKDEPLV